MLRSAMVMLLIGFGFVARVDGADPPAAAKDKPQPVQPDDPRTRDRSKFGPADPRRFFEIPDAPPGVATRPTGDFSRLPVVDEYVGPLPEKLPTMFNFTSPIKINKATGRVAYYYRFDAPEELFKAGEFMNSPVKSTITSGGEGSTAAMRHTRPLVRAIVDGIPSPIYRSASRPRFAGKAVKYVAEMEDDYRVVRDGAPGKVGFTSIRFWGSYRENDRLGYIVSLKLGTQQLLLNDEVGPEFERIRNADYSTDHRLIYVAGDFDKEKDEFKTMQLVVDQKPEKVYEFAGLITTSPDGRRYAYLAKQGDGWRVVLDGQEQPIYKGIGDRSLRFSPDSKRFAYAAFTGDKWALVVDGKEHPMEGGIYSSLAFGPDSRRFACVAKKEGQCVALVDGKATASFPGEIPAQLKLPGVELSPAGEPFFVILTGGVSQAFVHPGQEKPIGFSRVQGLTFNSDGSQIAYTGVRVAGGKKSSFVVLNDEVGPEHQYINDLQFSPDGKHLYYVGGKDEGEVLVTDGKEGLAADDFKQIAFSPDGQRMALRIKRGEEDVILLNGQEIAKYPYDAFFEVGVDNSLVFSPDGKVLAFFAQQGGKQFLVAHQNGVKQSPGYERIVQAPPVFETPTRIRFFAARDEALFRVYAAATGQSGEEPWIGGDSPISQETIAGWNNEGAAFERKEQPVIAAGYFRKAAELGHAGAQASLGYMYDKGYGPDPGGPSKAVRWTRMAAEQGQMVAMSNMGWYQRIGKGAPKDLTESLRWYRQSAEAGFVKANYEMGRIYKYAYGVQRDDRQAFDWFMKAADKGYAKAQFEVGYAYANARGVELDYQAAMRWYRKAADQGHAVATNNIGWLIAGGRGVERNMRVAKDWYRVAALKGNENARANLQNMLPDRRGSRGMYPWFKESKTVHRTITTGKYGEFTTWREFTVEVPSGDRNKPYKVAVPVYVYSQQQIAAATDVEGVIHTDKFPDVGIDDLRPLSDSDWKYFKSIYTDDAIAICYPPFLVIGKNLKGEPKQTRTVIQNYMERYYEESARQQ
jgi:TPR repeat protein/WD40 repeat protein